MRSPRISVVAILVGFVALPILYAALSAVSRLLVGHPAESPATWVLLAPIGALVIWLVPGIATGYLAGHSPATHGVALSVVFVAAALALVALSPAFGWNVQPWEIPYVIGFVVPVALGAIVGAFIGHRLARRRKK